LELVHFETLNQFSPSSFKIHGFSPFNQISLFDVSCAYHDCIWVVSIVWHIFTLMLSQIPLWNAFEMSNKLDKIWLKGLNSRISKNERLNWSKVLKWTNSKIHLKLRGPKTYLTLLLIYLLYIACNCDGFLCWLGMLVIL